MPPSGRSGRFPTLPYPPRWRRYYTHSCCCLKALNPKELQGLFLISPPTFLELSHIFVSFSSVRIKGVINPNWPTLRCFIGITIGTNHSAAGIKLSILAVIDYRRAERLPWSKPLIENPYNDEISFFFYNEGDSHKGIRHCIWLDRYNYVVVLQRKKSHYIWIMSFYVEGWKYKDLRKRFERRIGL